MILITGAAGFIGSVLVHCLNLKGREDIVVCDDFGNGQKWRNLRDLLFYQRVTPPELFSMPATFWKNIHHVYHLGAISSTLETDVDLIWKNNVDFSQKIFEQCTLHNIPLLYASSAATYGSGEQGYSDQHQKLHYLKPLNPYGYSKHFFDLWALKQVRTPPVWLGIKFFNVFGPHEYHKGPMRSVVIQAFEQIKETTKVKLFKSYRSDYEDGEQCRDFIYVKDAARALIDLLSQAKSEHSGIYNLGTGEARTWLDLAQSVFDALGKPFLVEFIDMPASLKNQYQYFTQAEMRKFYQVLPEFTFQSLEEGIADYVHHLNSGELQFLSSIPT